MRATPQSRYGSNCAEHTQVLTMIFHLAVPMYHLLLLDFNNSNILKTLKETLLDTEIGRTYFMFKDLNVQTENVADYKEVCDFMNKYLCVRIKR